MEVIDGWDEATGTVLASTCSSSISREEGCADQGGWARSCASSSSFHCDLRIQIDSACQCARCESKSRKICELPRTANTTWEVADCNITAGCEYAAAETIPAKDHACSVIHNTTTDAKLCEAWNCTRPTLRAESPLTCQQACENAGGGEQCSYEAATREYIIPQTCSARNADICEAAEDDGSAEACSAAGGGVRVYTSWLRSYVPGDSLCFGAHFVSIP